MPYGAIGGLISTGLNIFNANRTGRINRDFAREQYQTSRKDSLADYHMQNTYNTPLAQAGRLEEAGLNRSLMYGSAGDNSAASPAPADSNSANQQPAKIDFANSMQSFADIKFKKAQTNNLAAQTKLLEEEHDDKVFYGGMERHDKDVDRKNLLGYNMQAREDINKIRRAKHKKDLLNIDSNILKNNALTSEAQQRLKNLQQDNILKKWHVLLSNVGVTPETKPYDLILRAAFQFIITGKMPPVLQSLNNKTK